MSKHTQPTPQPSPRPFIPGGSGHPIPAAVPPPAELPMAKKLAEVCEAIRKREGDTNPDS